MSAETSAKTVTLLHVSDIHFGAVDHAALDALAGYVREHPPDAVVVAGDLTQSGRKHEFDAARAWLDTFECPCLVAPGNHDTPALNATQRLFAPFRRYATAMGARDIVGKVVELGEGRVRVGAINSARGVQGRINWAQGIIDLDDLRSTLDLLSEGPVGARRVLVCHHPLSEPGHARISVDTRRGGEALHLCAAAGVDAVLTGHIHDPFAHPVRLSGRQLVQMGSGTLSTRLRQSYASFCVVTLSESHVRQEVVTAAARGHSVHLNYDSHLHASEQRLLHPEGRSNG